MYRFKFKIEWWSCMEVLENREKFIDKFEFVINLISLMQNKKIISVSDFMLEFNYSKRKSQRILRSLEENGYLIIIGRLHNGYSYAVSDKSIEIINTIKMNIKNNIKIGIA